VKREIIRPFSAWDRQLCAQVELVSGIVVSNYLIVRSPTASNEPYRVEFQASNRQYWCALPAFLARTQSVAALEVAEAPVPASQPIAV
jgi:hypothetical protein